MIYLKKTKFSDDGSFLAKSDHQEKVITDVLQEVVDATFLSSLNYFFLNMKVICGTLILSNQ